MIIFYYEHIYIYIYHFIFLYKKIFFVIADGLITGAGETRSTPDIVIDMMDLDPTMRDPKPSSYLAIADGEKQLNMAKVVRLEKMIRNRNNLFIF